MNSTFKVGVVGYGNLGRGVEAAIAQNPDVELVAIFTRRPVDEVQAGGKVVHISKLPEYKGEIDVLILCGGSATDLPEQGPKLALDFNTVDSFDTHAKIPEYFQSMDESARKGGNLSLISTGWDPGLFSLARLLFSSVLPQGKDYTFWGRGVSQGHSDAIRRVPGVKEGIQYTVPVPEAIERVRAGENPELSAGEKHKRLCYVVPEEGADLQAIEVAIKTMPGYFAEYDTTVHFISAEKLRADIQFHMGFVIHNGRPEYQKEDKFGADVRVSSVVVAYPGLCIGWPRKVGPVRARYLIFPLFICLRSLRRN